MALALALAFLDALPCFLTFFGFGAALGLLLFALDFAPALDLPDAFAAVLLGAAFALDLPLALVSGFFLLPLVSVSCSLPSS